MSNLSNRVIRTALVGGLFALTPALASAQETEAEYNLCTATVDVASIPAGEAATPVTFSLSESIGEVTGIEAGESGLRTASPEDLGQSEMATEEAPKVIEMSAESEGIAQIWLNTLEAQPGTFEVTLNSETGSCTAVVTVEGGSA